MNPQTTVSPQPQVGVPVQPQAITTNPQGSASVAPLQAPTPSQLPIGQVQTPSINYGAIPQATNNVPSALSAIADYYKIPRQTADIVNTGQVAANTASAQFEAQKYQNTLAIQHEKDQLDPSTYKQEKNADGSVVMINSLGDKVDVGTYNALTGQQDPTAVLKNSTNPKDVAFVSAYNNLQDYINTRMAAQNGDFTARAKLQGYFDNNTGLENLNLGDLTQRFMAKYGTYMGASGSNDQSALSNAGVNDTVQGANNLAMVSPYINIKGFPRPNGTSNVVGQALSAGLSSMAPTAQPGTY